MILTDQIKEKLESADSIEKKHAILSDVKNKVMDAGVILDDSDLDQVSGGAAKKGGSYQRRARPLPSETKIFLLKSYPASFAPI